MKQIAKLKDEARKHEQKEEWAKAIDAYTQVLKLGEAGDGAELELPLYNRVGDLYVRLGRPMDAVKYYEQAADKYAEAGLFNNAIALCNKALRYDANRVELLKKLGQFSASQGFFTDARRWYLEYCEKMSKRGAMDEAFVALTELADVHDDAEIRELLARQLKEHGRTDQAILEFKRAYALRAAAGNTKAADDIRAELEALGSDVSTPVGEPVHTHHDDHAEELPGFLDEPVTASVGDGLVEEPVTDLALETMVPGGETYEETGSPADFGTIDLDTGLGGAGAPAAEEVQPLDIGLEPTLEFTPPTDEPPEEAEEHDDTDDGGAFELPTLDLGGPDEEAHDEDDFGDVDMALPTLDDDVDAEDLPTLDDHQTDEGEPLPLIGLDDGGEFGEDETGGEPLPLEFDIAEREALIEDELPAPAAEPEPPAEPEPQLEPEPVARYEEPKPEPEPAPLAAAPAPPPPRPAAPAKKKEYIDLASLLDDDDEEEAEDSTRFVVAEKPPTGDEEQDFADMLQQFKQKVAETIPKEDAGSHYDLGLAFKEMGLIDEAIAEFQTALRGGQEKLKVYEELGNCFVQKQQYSVAVTILNRAIQMPYNDETELLGVYYNLGRAHEELGQRAEAKAAYERIISVDIGFQDTTQRLAKL